VPSLSWAALTSITRRKPSRTSRSFLLSSNFFICAGGICLAGLRPAPASRAASSVRSRATTGQTGFSIMVMCLLLVYLFPACSKYAILTPSWLHCVKAQSCTCHVQMVELECLAGTQLPFGARHRPPSSCSHFESPPTLSYNLSISTFGANSLQTR
jgi:hypothetical protein